MASTNFIAGTVIDATTDVSLRITPAATVTSVRVPIIGNGSIQLV
jgi:hypothetical protein